MNKPKEGTMKTPQGLDRFTTEELNRAEITQADKDFFRGLVQCASDEDDCILFVACMRLRAAGRLSEVEHARDEAIKAHGLVWNAVRRAAHCFRWLGIPADSHKECAEDASMIFEAERLTPRWGTDWTIVSRIEKDARLAKTNARLEAAMKFIVDGYYGKDRAFVETWLFKGL